MQRRCESVVLKCALWPAIVLQLEERDAYEKTFTGNSSGSSFESAVSITQSKCLDVISSCTALVRGHFQERTSNRQQHSFGSMQPGT